MSRIGYVLLLLALLLPTSLHAATWSEFGDAGPVAFNANYTSGTGPLTAITGGFLSGYDADMYAIRIVDEANFYARLTCATINQPDLWLFDAAGNGIALDDGCMFGFTQITSALVTTNGVYYLAITASDYDAVNVLSQPIWNPTAVSGDRAPDGTGAPGPHGNPWWTGTPVSESGSYTILLNGADFFDSPTPTDAATWGVIKSLYR